MKTNWIPFEFDEDGCLVGSLPELDDEILICTKSGEVTLDIWRADEDGYYLESGWDICDTVVAWMPLPEPYREELG